MNYDSIKILTKTLGHNMSDLAKDMGVSRPTLQRMLANPKAMTVEQLDKFSSLVGITRDRLLK